MVLDLVSKTIDYHKLILNLARGNSITFELNKERKIKAGEYKCSITRTKI